MTTGAPVAAVLYLDVHCDDGEIVELILPSLETQYSSRNSVEHVVQKVLSIRKLNDKSLSYVDHNSLIVAVEAWNHGKSSPVYIDLSTDIHSLQSIYRALSSSSESALEKKKLLLFGFNRHDDAPQQVERLSRIIISYSDKLKQLNEEMCISFQQESLPSVSNGDESYYSSKLKLLQSFTESWIASTAEVFNREAEQRNRSIINDMYFNKFSACRDSFDRKDFSELIRTLGEPKSSFFSSSSSSWSSSSSSRLPGKSYLQVLDKCESSTVIQGGVVEHTVTNFAAAAAVAAASTTTTTTSDTCGGGSYSSTGGSDRNSNVPEASAASDCKLLAQSLDSDSDSEVDVAEPVDFYKTKPAAPTIAVSISTAASESHAQTRVESDSDDDEEDEVKTAEQQPSSSQETAADESLVEQLGTEVAVGVGAVTLAKVSKDADSSSSSEDDDDDDDDDDDESSTVGDSKPKVAEAITKISSVTANSEANTAKIVADKESKVLKVAPVIENDDDDDSSSSSSDSDDSSTNIEGDGDEDEKSVEIKIVDTTLVQKKSTAPPAIPVTAQKDPASSSSDDDSSSSSSGSDSDSDSNHSGSKKHPSKPTSNSLTVKANSAVSISSSVPPTSSSVATAVVKKIAIKRKISTSSSSDSSDDSEGEGEVKVDGVKNGKIQSAKPFAPDKKKAKIDTKPVKGKGFNPLQGLLSTSTVASATPSMISSTPAAKALQQNSARYSSSKSLQSLVAEQASAHVLSAQKFVLRSPSDLGTNPAPAPLITAAVAIRKPRARSNTAESLSKEQVAEAGKHASSGSASAESADDAEGSSENAPPLAARRSNRAPQPSAKAKKVTIRVPDSAAPPPEKTSNKGAKAPKTSTTTTAKATVASDSVVKKKVVVVDEDGEAADSQTTSSAQPPSKRLKKPQQQQQQPSNENEKGPRRTKDK